MLFLKSHIMLLSFSRDVGNNGTSCANRRVERQCVCESSRRVPIPVCHVCDSSLVPLISSALIPLLSPDIPFF